METPWVGKEERQKDNKIIEDMRQRRHEMEQEAKQMERAGKFNLAMTLSTQANTLVSDIIKLEDLISDRETGQPDPAWRVSLKEQELLDELEALEDEYSNQKRRMREAYRKNKISLYQTLAAKNTQLALGWIFRSKKESDFNVIEQDMLAAIEKLNKVI